MGKGTFKAKFQRFETKYVMSKEKLAALQEDLKAHLVADDHAVSTISNVYYDTPDYQVIQESMAKPYYKEKLRLRSYEAQPNQASQVFLEIKKKVRKIVYKRRITANLEDAETYMMGMDSQLEDSQIRQEIDWLQERFGQLKPMMYIYYDRYSMKGIEDSQVRVTIDHNLLYRDSNVSLDGGIYGDRLLPEDQVIMEIKIPGAFPMWLVDLLNKHEIYPNSFSKYGMAFKKVRQRTLQELASQA